MNIYHYDQTSGQFTFAGFAMPNHRNPENPLVPAFATTIAPPDARDGFVRIFNGTQWAYAPVPPDQETEGEPTISMSDRVDMERDARINGGFIFEGVRYQSRSGDRENIAGAKSLATDALALGAPEGDYTWQHLLDPTAPETFQWIAEDNSEHPMDAQTMVRFGYAALAHKQRLIFAARAIKNMTPIPEDFATNNAYW
ncbi:MAG: hypothetical protein DI528_12855 [Shinella sp.]|nr:MAG: hypothetical protein DI528_12855 [Shinella sp.]